LPRGWAQSICAIDTIERAIAESDGAVSICDKGYRVAFWAYYRTPTSATSASMAWANMARAPLRKIIGEPILDAPG